MKSLSTCLLLSALVSAGCARAEGADTTLPDTAPLASWQRLIEGHGARAPGLPGNLALQAAVEKRFAESGFTNGVIRFDTPVFLPGSTQFRLSDGVSHAVHPMHPTLLRPGNFPESQFESSLVYLGKGGVEDLKRAHGTDLNNAIAVMEFDCRNRWMDMLRFGVRGFIFLPASRYAHRESVEKVYNSEVCVPRFLASESAAAALRKQFAEAQSTTATVIAEPSRWQVKELGNPWVLVEGSHPDATRDVLLITAPIDAASAVPEMALGGDTAGNLMMLLDLLEIWRKTPPRCSVLLVAVNAHTQGYLGERMLAWHLLQRQDDVTLLRDNLAMEMRQAAMYVQHYSKLKLAPVELPPEMLSDAVRLLGALAALGHDADPLRMDDAMLRAGVDEARREVVDRTEGLGARMFMTDEGREHAAATLRRLDAFHNGDMDELRKVLAAARSTFEDEKLLEDWRSRIDTSTGVRLAVKTPLQDRVQRELNMTKSGQMDLGAATGGDPAEVERLKQRRESLTRLLVLFNKIDIGYARERMRYRQIAGNNADRESLLAFRDFEVNERTRRVELFQRRLDADTARGDVRRALGTRTVRLSIALAVDWSVDRAGFLAFAPPSSKDWYRSLGDQAATVAAGLPPPAGANAAPYMDTLSSAVDQPQIAFFRYESPARLFHAAGGVASMALQSVYSERSRAFTPQNSIADLPPDSTAARFDWFRNFIVALAAEPGVTDQKPLTIDWNQGLWSCLVKTFEMDEFASKPTPSLPVRNVLVAAYTPDAWASIIDGDVANVNATLVDDTAFGTFQGLHGSPFVAEAYQLDAERQATVTAVLDKGRIQESKQMNVTLDRTPSKTFPMFAAREFVIGNRTDPSLAGRDGAEVGEFWIFSGKSRAAPKKYGIQGANPLSRSIKPRTATGPVGVYQDLNPRKGTAEPLIIMTSRQRFAVNPTDAEPEGIGFAAPSDLDSDFMNRAARDMHDVIRHRLGNMKGIVNELVEEFLDRGESALQAAAEAGKSRDHVEHNRSTAVALGNLAKAYTQIRSVNADMLKAIMIYMALMLPFCYFLQKLIFSFVRIEHEMLAFALLFIATYTVFRLIHPAFSVAMSPEAIFLAFVLGTIGVFVTAMLHGRFSAEMDILFRGSAGFAAEATTAFVGQTAMIIGVNNMRRRRTRTALTTATIVLVVFTMLAFSSVSRKVRPTLVMQADKAPYTGIFMAAPDEDTLRAMETLFADRGELLARWALSAGATPTGGRIRWPVERLDAGDRIASVTTLLSLSPQESRFAGAMPFACGGMFSSGHADEVILSSPIADVMAIGPEDIGKAAVMLLGRRLTVVGVIDAERYWRMRDLTPHATLLPSGGAIENEADAASERGAQTAGMQDLAELVFLPAGLIKELGGRPYSISIRLIDHTDDDTPRSLWDEVDVLLRSTDAMFTIGSVEPFKVEKNAGRATDAGVYQVVGAYRTTIGGLSRLLVPLLIAGLILFNTMLSTVYERKAEIAIYNAIGLNPRHIFIFFLAEALVYGVIGAIGGYLIGQILAMTAQQFDLVGGMNVNFSSLMVVWAIMFTVGLVLLSTIYPAWVAVRTAVPSGTSRWALPKHDGQRMRVDLPFIYEPRLAAGVMAYLHEILAGCVDDSMSDMLADVRSLSGKETANGHPVFQAAYGLALAPFDLGVTQSMEVKAQFVPALESYEMTLDIQRESGQDSSWAAVNQPMLERFRKA
ncbi:MAG: ABC transporter permease, partial [Lentisphaerae bacterium]|nr:ABC transporter permease [Lentisphaerota bacterium]